jgi:hypothetical protein
VNDRGFEEVSASPRDFPWKVKLRDGYLEGRGEEGLFQYTIGCGIAINI